MRRRSWFDLAAVRRDNCRGIVLNSWFVEVWLIYVLEIRGLGKMKEVALVREIWLRFFPMFMKLLGVDVYRRVLKCGLRDKISLMLSLGLCFILILLDILLNANIYVWACAYVRVLITTEGKRRSSDVTTPFTTKTIFQRVWKIVCGNLLFLRCHICSDWLSLLGASLVFTWRVHVFKEGHLNITRALAWGGIVPGFKKGAELCERCPCCYQEADAPAVDLV